MKSLQSLLAAVCIAAVVSGCGKSEAPKQAMDSGTNAPAAGKRLKLAFVSNNAATFWTIARTGCEAAAAELGNVDVDFGDPFHRERGRAAAEAG